MKHFFALPQPPEPPVPEDIEIIVRRKRGHKQNWFSKLHILIIEIIALVCLLIWAVGFIKAKIDGFTPSASASGQQQTQQTR